MLQYRISMLQVANIPPFGWMQGIDITASGVKLSVLLFPVQLRTCTDSLYRREIIFAAVARQLTLTNKYLRTSNDNSKSASAARRGPCHWRDLDLLGE